MSEQDTESVKSWVVGLDVLGDSPQVKENDVAATGANGFYLARIFQPGCVLQCEQEIPVWGWASAGDRIVCEVAGQQAECVCGDDGRFMVRLPECKSSPDALSLIVSNVTSGESLLVRPVYIGEVYLVSGQSNMAFSMKGEDHFKDMATAGQLSSPQIHIFKIPVSALKHPPVDLPETVVWQEASEETVAKVSAIGFLVARQLVQSFPETHVGVIDSSCGGTGIEAWTSREGLADNPFWGPRLNIYHSPEHRDRDGMEVLREMFPSLPSYDEKTEDYHRLECQDGDWETMTVPDSWTMTGRNYAGIFWFRRDFELDSVPEEGITLSLGAVDKGDETYVNGQLVGKMGDGLQMETAFTNRVYHVPASVLRVGRNVIAVRILSAVSIVADGGLIGPAEEMFVGVGERRLSLTGTWRFKETANLGTKAADSFSFCGEGSGHSMHILYDNMLAPILPYAVRVAAWYQGECNAVCQASEYYECLKSWAKDWTNRWGQKKLDLIVIQLPGYMRKDLYQPYSQWAIVREAQQRFCREYHMPLVVTTDTGDVDNIHPTDKAVVAQRMADILAASKLGQDIPQSPVAMRAEAVDPGKIQVRFDCYGSRLRRDVCGTQCVLVKKDGSWMAVEPEVIADDVIELAAEASEVTKVIYNWGNFPIGRLYAANGLPVAPFACEVRPEFR